MPLYKYAANAWLNKPENAVLQLSLSDYLSGYMLYSPRALEHIAFNKLSDSFDFDLKTIRDFTSAASCVRLALAARALEVQQRPLCITSLSLLSC